MCDECRVLSHDMILGYMIECEVPFAIAVRLTRDSIVQRTLMDRVGEDALKAAVELSAIVGEVADQMETITRENPALMTAALAAARIRLAEKQ